MTTQYEVKAGDKFEIMVRVADKEDETIFCTAEAHWNGRGNLLVFVEYGCVPRTVKAHPNWTALKTRISVCADTESVNHLKQDQQIPLSWQSTRGEMKVEAGTLAGFKITSPVVGH